jgi:hypothetical protein
LQEQLATNNNLRGWALLLAALLAGNWPQTMAAAAAGVLKMIAVKEDQRIPVSQFPAVNFLIRDCVRLMIC